MNNKYRYIGRQNKISLGDMQWFYAKSKVSICLAITESYPVLVKFREANIISEEESLELQADTRSAHRVIYELLSRIEEKDFPLEYSFENLFQKPFLKIYPNLKPIYKEYKQGKYSVQITTDKDQDEMIFAQEKVKICLAITDLFPFIHGLKDLTILSEREALKLQADGRPISRVIYECLSLIEKKDLKLSVVFEYIFQPCYQTLYPGLQVILKDSSVEQEGPFNGKHQLVFNRPDDLLTFYEKNKSNISDAINECFPFLNGLHDMRLLSKLEILKLQADKRAASDVLYEALSWIQERGDIEAFFIHTFREFNLNRFPDLKIILHRLNKSLILDRCLPVPSMKDIMLQQTRRCRLKPICYTELSDYDWELAKERKKHAVLPTSNPREKGVKSLVQQKPKRKQHKKTKLIIPKDDNWNVTTAQKWIRDAVAVTVKLEFPKQVFNDEFLVRCGHKKGVFKKKHWKGDSRNDMCITCDKKLFTVTKFEKYGGREAAKKWKKTIYCGGITIDKLFQSGILKSPINNKRRL